MRNVRSGFSMIELLVVIAVIGILAGVLLPVLGTMRQKGRVAATSAALKNIEVALRQYDFDFGRYPPDPGTDTNYDLSAECLVFYLGTPFRKMPTKSSHVKATKNGGPYFEFKHEYLMSTDGDDNQEFVDYWQQPFQYDNIRDDSVDPDGFTDAGGEGFGSDPRADGKPRNVNSYDVWSRGITNGARARDYVANFKP